MNAKVEQVNFPGAMGDTLAARLDRPPTPPRAVALFAHCFTCSKDIAAASRVSAGLVDAGFAVLRFDFTGLGSSDGEFANTNFSSNVADLIAAADYLRDHLAAPQLLVGHSLGGTAVLAAAGQIPEVRAVATIGAPRDPAHVTTLIDATDLERVRDAGEAVVRIAGREFTVRQQFLDDVGGRRLDEIVAGLDAPLLVLHAPDDDLVPVDHANAIFDAANHPKSFVSLDGANHLLTDRNDAVFVAGILASWAGRYVDWTASDGVTGSTQPPPPEGYVMVEETHAEPHHFAQRVVAGRHTLPADEPIGIGDDTGPTPYDYLLAALGTCTSMTLRMYADRKKLPVDHLSVFVRHDRVHAEDCADESGKPCRIEQLTRVISVEGDDLTDDHRASLLRIADKCPVHRTLEGDIHVLTEID